MKPIIFILFMTSFLFFSCTKNKEEATPPVDTEKNLFEELKDQTVKNPKDAEAWYHLSDLYERSEAYTAKR